MDEKKRLLRQVINFMWEKNKNGTLTKRMLFRIIDIIQVPTPTEWREDYEKYRQEYKNYLAGKLGQ